LAIDREVVSRDGGHVLVSVVETASPYNRRDTLIRIPQPSMDYTRNVDRVAGRLQLPPRRFVLCPKITGSGLEHLKGLTQLKTLAVGHTQVTDASKAELKEAMPKVTIVHVMLMR